MRRVRAAKGVPMVVYESTLDSSGFCGSEVTYNPWAFGSRCVIVDADRWANDLFDAVEKVCMGICMKTSVLAESVLEFRSMMPE